MYHRTMWVRHLGLLHLGLLIVALAACGDDGSGTPIDAASGDSGTIINGCLSLSAPQANPGDPIDGDTFATAIAPIFQSRCTRCHSTTLSGAARNGAPLGFNWDDEASVRQHLAEIRNAIGVLNFMPPSDPRPTCDERRRVVRWIDADAP